MASHLIAEPLDAQRFAPFGSVVSAGLGHSKDANQGSARRFDWTAALESTRPNAKPNLVVARCAPQTLPLLIKLVERHPGSTQTFLPMIASSYLVVVAPKLPDGAPDVGGLRAFVCKAGQGISYARDVWHHPIVALDSEADFAMLVWEDGTADDCIEHWLKTPITVASS